MAFVKYMTFIPLVWTLKLKALNLKPCGAGETTLSAAVGPYAPTTKPRPFGTVEANNLPLPFAVVSPS